MRGVILVFAALATVCTALRAGAGFSDPANEIIRIRARLTTAARRADLSLQTGTIVNARARLISGSATVAARFDAPTCRLENESPREAEVECLWLATNLPPDGAAEWRVALEGSASVVVEIYNANSDRRSRLVDRVADHADRLSISTPVKLLREGGPPPIGSAGEARVLAFYYPWYLHSSWDDPQLTDRSPSRYSTDEQPDVTAEFVQARSAGLDGLVMSWNGVNRPMRLAVAAAHATRLRISTLIETDAAR